MPHITAQEIETTHVDLCEEQFPLPITATLFREHTRNTLLTLKNYEIYSIEDLRRIVGYKSKLRRYDETIICALKQYGVIGVNGKGPFLTDKGEEVSSYLQRPG